MTDLELNGEELPGRVRLIGGELPTWSDLTSAWEPARCGAQLPVLLAALSGRTRVLLAGPHETDLVAAVAAAVPSVTCLVRSLPDAQLLAEGLDPQFDEDHVRVVCGSLERYDETGGFDAVVALDDIGRLYSTEGPEATFAGALADLRRLSSADGVLVLMVGNELGVHRLTARVQPEADQSQPAWAAPACADDTRPRTPAELAALFDRAGFDGAVSWPVYPLPTSPTVAWGPAAADLDRTAYAGLFAAVSTTAARVIERSSPLSDPHLLLRRIWRSNRLADLAPAWLLVTSPGADDVSDMDGVDDVVGWLSAEAGAEPEVVRVDGGVPRLADGSEVPAGRLVSDLLLQAVISPDQAALRSIVAGYADWLEELADPAPAAATRVVVRADGVHHLLAIGPAPSPAAESADEQLLAAITDVVRLVETNGYRRTWPSHLTAPEAVAWVAAMRGTPVPPDLVRRHTTEAGLAATPPSPAGSTDPAASAETGPAVDLVRERHEESNATRARWFESRLQSAENQLAAAVREVAKARQRVARANAETAELRNRLTALDESRAVRLGRALGSPLRTTTRLARRTLKRR